MFNPCLLCSLYIGCWQVRGEGEKKGRGDLKEKAEITR